MSKHIAKQYELPLPKKPRYSYSVLELAKCGAKYYYAKIEKGPTADTYNLASGRMFDLAFNSYYEGNAHLTESHEQRLAYARATVDLHLTDSPQYFEMQWSKKAGDPRSSPENFVAWMFDLKALELVCRHDRGPVEVQKKVELQLPNYSIVGYIDCLELATNTIVDIKAVTGWGAATALSYALRSQIPLYRMLLKDTEGLDTKGRYELVLCRKKPSLVEVPDADVEFLQDKLIADFDAHHQKMVTKNFSKNPDQCFMYNKPCDFFSKCWPKLAHLLEQPTITEQK